MGKKSDKKILLIFTTIIIALLIFYFSIIPSTPAPQKPGFDKIKHFFSYIILSISIYYSTKSKKLAFFIAGTYGLLIEIIQYTLPYRSFSIFDVLVNYLGAAIIFLPIFKNK